MNEVRFLVFCFFFFKMVYERRSLSALRKTDIQQKLVSVHITLHLQVLSAFIDN